MMSIGLHSALDRPGRPRHALREFIEYAQKKGDVWFARRIDIANWWHRAPRRVRTVTSRAEDAC